MLSSFFSFLFFLSFFLKLTPNFDPNNFLSANILANTGKADIPIATPINKPNFPNATLEYSGVSNINAVGKPIIMGILKLNELINIDVFAFALITAVSILDAR